MSSFLEMVKLRFVIQKGREIEKHAVPAGAILKVDEGQQIKANTKLCEWNPFSIPVLSEVSGKVRYDDVVEGETMGMEKDASGTIRKSIIEHKGELHPQIVIEDESGTPLDFYYLPERAYIMVEDGQMISGGTRLPRRLVKHQERLTSPAVYLV